MADKSPRRVRANSKLVMLRDDEHGRKRELEVVDIEDLAVDLDYQREFRQYLVERILEDYDPLAADPIDVSLHEDGTMWIINGQHHASAAQQWGEKEALAWVYTGLTSQEESDFRLKKNNSSPDSSLEKFHAKLHAGTGDNERLRELYSDATVIAGLAREYGTHINRVNNKKTGLNCVSAIEAVYKVDNGLLLRNTFALLRDAFGEIHGEVATADAVRGVAWFLRQHSTEVNHAELHARLRRAGVDDLKRKSRAYQASMGGALWVNFYRAMVEVYNHRRAEHNRIEWRTKFKSIIDEAAAYSSER